MDQTEFGVFGMMKFETFSGEDLEFDVFSIWDILHLVFSLEMPSMKVSWRAFGILCV